MDNNVKPCPFCGNKALLYESNPDENKDGRTWWKIECGGAPEIESADCIGQYINLWHVTKDDAIAAWNHRQVTIGYKLVPIEPTTEMQAAGAQAIRFDTTPINKLWTGNAVYRAMISAIK